MCFMIFQVSGALCIRVGEIQKGHSMLRTTTVKRELFIAMVGCVLMAGMVVDQAMAGKRNRGGGGQPAPQPVLTEAEAADLLFMREEEKLAHDVYVVLYQTWGLTVFDNISASEQKHTDAVLRLINSYGLEDPAKGFGEFTDLGLQQLFIDLVAQGTQTKLAALEVGVAIEEKDIDDIVEASNRTDQADIIKVYGNLLAGSHNHLAAFLRNIEAITD